MSPSSPMSFFLQLSQFELLLTASDSIPGYCSNLAMIVERSSRAWICTNSVSSIQQLFDFWRLLLENGQDRTMLQAYYLAGITIAVPIITINFFLPKLLDNVIFSAMNHRLDHFQCYLYLGLRLFGSRYGLAAIQTYILTAINIKAKQISRALIFCHVLDLSADVHFSKNSSDLYTVIQSTERIVTQSVDSVLRKGPRIADAIVSIYLIHQRFGQAISTMTVLAVIMMILKSMLDFRSNTTLDQASATATLIYNRHMSSTLFHWKAVMELGRIDEEKKQHMSNSEASSLYMLENASRTLSAELGQGLFIATCCLAAGIIQARMSEWDVTQAASTLALIGPCAHMIDTVQGVSKSFEGLQLAGNDAEKTLNFLRQRPSIRSPADSPPFVHRGCSLEFQNVSFSYDGNSNATQSLSFAAASGDKIAILGTSGCGKSTILNLIHRTFDPASGKVVVDGQDISSVTLDTYRKHIAIVPQHPALFNVSVKENIRYANPSASDKDIIEACKLSEVHEKIMSLPQRYDQKITGLGQTFSGGEIQRLAVARLFVQRPDIILLDEPTSHLDGDSEHKIWAALNKFRKGRTMFVVSHRPSTVLDSDKVIIIRKGCAIEQGKPHDLEADESGVFHRLLQDGD